jgi:hypothetical protein
MRAPETTNPLISAVSTVCEWFAGTVVDEFIAADGVPAGVEVREVMVTVTSDVESTEVVADCGTGLAKKESVKGGPRKFCVFLAAVVDEVDIVEVVIEIPAAELPVNHVSDHLDCGQMETNQHHPDNLLKRMDL